MKAAVSIGLGRAVLGGFVVEDQAAEHNAVLLMGPSKSHPPICVCCATTFGRPGVAGERGRRPACLRAGRLASHLSGAARDGAIGGSGEGKSEPETQGNAGLRHLHSVSLRSLGVGAASNVSRALSGTVKRCHAGS